MSHDDHDACIGALGGGVLTAIVYVFVLANLWAFAGVNVSSPAWGVGFFDLVTLGAILGALGAVALYNRELR